MHRSAKHVVEFVIGNHFRIGGIIQLVIEDVRLQNEPGHLDRASDVVVKRPVQVQVQMSVRGDPFVIVLEPEEGIEVHLFHRFFLPLCRRPERPDAVDAVDATDGIGLEIQLVPKHVAFFRGPVRIEIAVIRIGEVTGMDGHRTDLSFVIRHQVFGDDGRSRAVAALVGSKVLHQHALDRITLRERFKRRSRSVDGLQVICCHRDDGVIQLVTPREEHGRSANEAKEVCIPSHQERTMDWVTRRSPSMTVRMYNPLLSSLRSSTHVAPVAGRSWSKTSLPCASRISIR